MITTHNRREELRRALASALRQTGDVEILVFDDGSSDGTAEMVRDEFPAVRVHREPRALGLIVARNRAAELVDAPVIVSIDDDAEFVAPDTVEQTLRDLDAPAIGAVAIPHLDVNKDGRQAPRAPDGDAVWVTSVYVGTAHAIRRDLFLALGGYRGDFVRQGEELDFCLRLLDAGWWVRLGRAAQPILHHESPKRDLEQIDVYGRRNEILHVWLNAPARWVLPHVAYRIVNGLRLGLHAGQAAIDAPRDRSRVEGRCRRAWPPVPGPPGDDPRRPPSAARTRRPARGHRPGALSPGAAPGYNAAR